MAERVTPSTIGPTKRERQVMDARHCLGRTAARGAFPMTEQHTAIRNRITFRTEADARMALAFRSKQPSYLGGGVEFAGAGLWLVETFYRDTGEAVPGDCRRVRLPPQFAGGSKTVR